MSIPHECEVLVVGGGPAGAYTAAALAREDVGVVLLEADLFPRYHVGESMLPSMRHFLRFIDLDSTFDKNGFVRKLGAAFKINAKETGYSDFLAAGGPDGYTWNVVRSESDDLMFRHAGKSGAKTFDGVKVNYIEFSPLGVDHEKVEASDLGRPVSATWVRKDGSSGVIKFRYLVDASGRAGIVSTKYMKNRRYNQCLKNVASWGYWKGTGQTGEGTERVGQPFFEALSDASGWAWGIPLHNDTMSVGVVMNQHEATCKKRAIDSASQQNFYLESIKLAPDISQLLSKAELVSDIKSGSDWSYSASFYASPYLRIIGDAGSFIDPFFSSGVHLALAGALSAAATICAAKRGDCEESAAAKWHSDKVTEGYTRFLLVVLSAMKQIREQDEPVLSDWDEEGFDRAFALIRPIIQGTVQTNGKLTQEEISKTVDFCLHAWIPAASEQCEAVIRKLKTNGTSNFDPTNAKSKADLKSFAEALSPDEMRILKTIGAKKVLRSEDTMSLTNFNTDTIDGMALRFKRGCLGLEKTLDVSGKRLDPKPDVLATMLCEVAMKGEQMSAKGRIPISAS